MSKWLINAKKIEYAPQDIPISKFNISFQEMFRDYVIYFPGTTDQYVTRIGDTDLGFGPRYLLKKLLYEVHQSNPDGTVNTSYIEVRTIPKLEEPIMRRLGKSEKDKLVKKVKVVADESDVVVGPTACGPETIKNDVTGNLPGDAYVAPNTGTTRPIL